MTIKEENKKSKFKPRAFDKDFRRAAVIKLESRGSAVTADEVAASLGVHASQLYDWRKKYGQQPRVLESVEAENKRLRKELADARRERDILKKSIALFVKDIV